MGYKKKKTRGDRKRGFDSIRKMKERDRPPKGWDGGEEGIIRGEKNERLFADTLMWLKGKGQILDFSQEDKKRKDFYIWIMNKKKRLKLTIEVKSSEFGRDEYNRATERMKKQGKNTVADMLVIIKDDDNVLILSDKVISDIDRTLRERKLS